MNFCSGFLKHNVELSYHERRNEDFSSDVILQGRPILGEHQLLSVMKCYKVHIIMCYSYIYSGAIFRVST